MKKIIIAVLLVIVIVLSYRCSSSTPILGGFYQTQVNGYHIQMLIQKEDNRFIEWIDNREVDRGSYTKNDDTAYSFESDIQNFDIELKDDNSFELIIKKVGQDKPIKMKNISADDTTTTFGSWDDVDEYKSLLD